MSTTLTKRAFAGVFAALFAVLMALAMAPGAAWAAGSWWDGITHGEDGTSEYGQGWAAAVADPESDAAKEVAFTVYTQYADEYAVPVKEFTRAELLGLAKENSEMLGTLYNAKNADQVYLSDCYVTIKQLLANAGRKGTSFNDEDTMYMAEGVDENGQPKRVVIKGNEFSSDNTILNDDKKFFPNFKASAEDAVSAPASIAFSWTNGPIGDNTAKAAAADMKPYFGDSARLLCGTTSMDAIPAGNTSPSGVTGLIIYTPASDKFDVYSKDSSTAEAKLVKSYTRESLSALATNDVKGFLFNSPWNVGVTTNSVEVNKLINDAGLKLEEGDTLVFAAPDGFETKLTYADVQSEKYFYPNAVGETCDVNGAVEVGTVLALNWRTEMVSGSAAATVQELAAGPLTNKYRLFTGVSEKNYVAKEAAGKRFATNPKTLTLIKGEKKTEPVNPTPVVNPTDDTKAKPAVQTISAKNTSKSYKGKKGKLAKNQTIQLKSAAKVSAKTAVTYSKANKAGAAKIKVAKNGKMTIKKGLKKGTYKVQVKLSAAANASYAAATKTITVTVKVK